MYPKDPVYLKGLYPDLRYGTQELTKHIQQTLIWNLLRKLLFLTNSRNNWKHFWRKIFEIEQVHRICYNPYGGRDWKAVVGEGEIEMWMLTMKFMIEKSH